ncbi:hypothetical protein [Paenibacillus alginolyticus]|uniref:hypothetical protein n=1 Tax=Paenibacillus alginolyticus TaxID=59839 RepID=UPI001567B0D0|nr:hypothetical protein [Paenibacillus frigoriresistens]
MLPNGISGFHINDLPYANSLQFKRLCDTLANYNNGKVLSFEEPHVAQNFYKAELDFKGKSIFVLLNTSYPFIAFASSVEYFKIKFVDHSLSNVINAFGNGLRILLADELNERLQLDEKTRTVKNENCLNNQELDQIFYWKPEIVGDVIFNFWD